MTEHHDWRQARRERTRLLIEYGGLVIKAGLGELLEDDRATLLGALLSLRDQLTGSEAGEAGNPPPPILKQRWRRRGLRAFDADPRPQKGERMENKSAMEVKPP